MERQEIFAKLNQVFADVFERDGIVLTESTTAKDVEGWDSLIHITLMAEIEDVFDMKFSMKEILGMENVGEMVDIIAREIQ